MQVAASAFPAVICQNVCCEKKSCSVVNLCEGFKRVNVINHIFNPGTCVYCMLSAFCMFSFKKTMLQCTFKNLNNPNQPSPIVRPVTAVTSIHFGRRGAWISDLLTTVLHFFFLRSFMVSLISHVQYTYVNWQVVIIIVIILNFIN